jgi:S1-C subfamily serine protease
MPFRLREVPGLRAGGGSDHASFFSAGVPGFFWGQAGKANYTTTHHTQHDTFDRAVPEYQKHSSIVVALTALGIANLDHLLSREGMNAPAGAPGGPGGNRRLLGIQLEDLTIAEVIEDGVAAKAGLKAGDSILKLGDKPVGSVEEFMELMRAPEAPKSITVKRDGKELEIKLDFPARPMP